VVSGGWSSLFPFFINTFYLGQLPLLRILCALPGTFLGAMTAPYIAKWLGW
jgi:hypothetical protein